MSAACDIAVANVVCVKNDGEGCISNFKQKINIPSGSHTVECIRRSDSKRLKRAKQGELKTKKLGL